MYREDLRAYLTTPFPIHDVLPGLKDPSYRYYDDAGSEVTTIPNVPIPHYIAEYDYLVIVSLKEFIRAEAERGKPGMGIYNWMAYQDWANPCFNDLIQFTFDYVSNEIHRQRFSPSFGAVVKPYVKKAFDIYKRVMAYQTREGREVIERYANPSIDALYRKAHDDYQVALREIQQMHHVLNNQDRRVSPTVQNPYPTPTRPATSPLSTPSVPDILLNPYIPSTLLSSITSLTVEVVNRRISSNAALRSYYDLVSQNNWRNEAFQQLVQLTYDLSTFDLIDGRTQGPKLNHNELTQNAERAVQWLSSAYLRPHQHDPQLTNVLNRSIGFYQELSMNMNRDNHRITPMYPPTNQGYGANYPIVPAPPQEPRYYRDPNYPGYLYDSQTGQYLPENAPPPPPPPAPTYHTPQPDPYYRTTAPTQYTQPGYDPRYAGQRYSDPAPLPQTDAPMVAGGRFNKPHQTSLTAHQDRNARNINSGYFDGSAPSPIPAPAPARPSLRVTPEMIAEYEAERLRNPPPKRPLRGYEWRGNKVRVIAGIAYVLKTTSRLSQLRARIARDKENLYRIDPALLKRLEAQEIALGGEISREPIPNLIEDHDTYSTAELIETSLDDATTMTKLKYHTSNPETETPGIYHTGVVLTEPQILVRPPIDLVKQIANSTSFAELLVNMQKVSEKLTTEPTRDGTPAPIEYDQAQKESLIEYIDNLDRRLTHYFNETLKNRYGDILQIDSFMTDFLDMISLLKEKYEDVYFKLDVENQAIEKNWLYPHNPEYVDNYQENLIGDTPGLKVVLIGHQVSMTYVDLYAAELSLDDDTDGWVVDPSTLDPEGRVFYDLLESIGLYKAQTGLTTVSDYLVTRDNQILKVLKKDDMYSYVLLKEHRLHTPL